MTTEDFQGQTEVVTLSAAAETRRNFTMQAGNAHYSALAKRAIYSRLTCLPIESLPLTQCVGATLRENIYAEARSNRPSTASPWTGWR